ncbi:hypothetical protein PCL_09563 [Purpureocillium lilacinum]|uniref:Uncharacterized protein n=1 Tax=Purpureocillium lilacinum TaxID=33203 RepID=A0A2U3DQM4_PURLI|nr:hypothetical protein PCL_09563 [Purpureocillium lilacinum]
MVVHLGQALRANVGVLGKDAPIPGKRGKTLEGPARPRPVRPPLPQLLPWGAGRRSTVAACPAGVAARPADSSPRSQQPQHNAMVCVVDESVGARLQQGSNVYLTCRHMVRRMDVLLQGTPVLDRVHVRAHSNHDVTAMEGRTGVPSQSPSPLAVDLTRRRPSVSRSLRLHFAYVGPPNPHLPTPPNQRPSRQQRLFHLNPLSIHRVERPPRPPCNFPRASPSQRPDPGDATMQAVDDIFDRAEATPARTSYRSRCWISSYWRDTFYTRPLRVLPMRTKARYKSKWKEFICYLFRAIALEPQKRREIHNIPLRADEITMMHHVLSLASRLQDEGEADGAVNDDQGSDRSWCKQSASERGESTEADGAGEDEGSNDEGEGSDISIGFSVAETSDDDETSNDDDVFCEEDHGSHGEQHSSHRHSVSLPHGTRLELAEALFQLSMMFWTHQCQTGVLDSSTLVHFTAVMGIHRTSLAYRSAYNYTPSLAALMWVGRLFFLEYALPLYSYNTLVYVWPARNTYPSQPERLQAIRTKYILRGCHTPIGEILELKAFGKSIIKKEGYRSNLTWSLDGQSFTIGNDKVVHLSDFCTAHSVAIWRVQEQVDEMMLGWEPMEDLSTIADDLTNKVPGWCFLDSPENGFVGKYKAMTRRVWLSSFRGSALAKAGQWLSCSCLTYLEAGIELATKIFVALHLTAGLPGRGTEITSIRLRNTKLAARNVFVREGQILIVISYSKSRASNNHAFYTVRYLPKDLASSVLAYLTYIWPFIDFLANRLELPQFRSNEFLFPDSGAKHSRKHLSSTPATAALRLFTSRLRTPWTLSLYRQAAIAIARRYISELIKKRNFYYPTGASAPVNMIAAGVGHHPYMLLTAYAIDTALPARLQPELLEMYQRLSTIWQDWNSQYHQSGELRRAISPVHGATNSRISSTSIKGSQRREIGVDDVSSPKRRKRKESAEQPDGQSHDESHPPDGFIFNDQYGIIICVECESMVQPGRKSQYRHLRSQRHAAGSHCQDLLERLSRFPVSSTEQLVTPQKTVPVIPGLKIYDAFRCNICRFFTIHRNLILDHMSTHKLGVSPMRAYELGHYEPSGMAGAEGRLWRPTSPMPQRRIRASTPLGHALAWRNYLGKVGKSAVTRHQARWSQDGQSLTLNGVTLHMDHVPQLLVSEYRQAHRLLFDELLFGADDIAPVESWRVHDDLDLEEYGGSWLTDKRNAEVLPGVQDALWRQIQSPRRIAAGVRTGRPGGAEGSVPQGRRHLRGPRPGVPEAAGHAHPTLGESPSSFAC